MHPPDDDLRKYHSKTLSPEKAAMIEAHLADCNICHQSLQELSRTREKPRAADADERRKDIRVPLDVSFTLKVLEPSAVAFTGQILDISQNGLKITLSARLRPGQYVQTRMGGRIVMAEVRYCLQEGAHFVVGLEIKDVFIIPGADAHEDDGPA